MTRILLLIFFLSHTSLSQEYGILFTKQVNNNDNIFLLSTSGKFKKITNHQRKDSSPNLSPNGKYIVFTSERVGWWKIWLYNIEKNSFKQLTQSNAADYSPDWSPDGKHIVFVSGRNGNSDIFTMTKNGKKLTNISKNNRSNTTPFWGKDNKIYYSTKINENYQIVKSNIDGTKTEIVTKSNGNKFMPQLSNDFQKILFYGDLDGNLELYLMNSDDKKITRLTNHPLMDMRAKWSANNEEIVFERGNKGNNHHIFIMNIKQKTTRQLTFENYNYAPSFIQKNMSFLKLD